jgi:hypothetical protein
MNNFNIILPSVASLLSSVITNGYLTDILSQSPASSIHWTRGLFYRLHFTDTVEPLITDTLINEHLQ